MCWYSDFVTFGLRLARCPLLFPLFMLSYVKWLHVVPYCGSIFTMQTCEWCQSSHLTLGQKATKHISQTVKVSHIHSSLTLISKIANVHGYVYVATPIKAQC